MRDPIGFWYDGRFYRIIAGGSGEDDAGADDAGTNDSGADDATEDDAASDDASKSKPKPPAPISLTSSQLNDRLEKARSGERKRLAKEAGFGEDVAAYTKFMSDAKTRREAEQGEALTLRQQQSELTAERDRLANELRMERLNSAVESVAVQIGFADPEDAIRLASFADALDDDSKPDRAIIKTTLDALAKAKPYLLKAAEDNVTRRANGSNPPRSGGVADAARQADLEKRFPYLKQMKSETVH